MTTRRKVKSPDVIPVGVAQSVHKDALNVYPEESRNVLVVDRVANSVSRRPWGLQLKKFSMVLTLAIQVSDMYHTGHGTTVQRPVQVAASLRP